MKKINLKMYRIISYDADAMITPEFTEVIYTFQSFLRKKTLSALQR